MSKTFESKGVEDLSKKIDNPDDTVELVEKMIENKKNKILMVAHHQGIFFRKFKENN